MPGAGALWAVALCRAFSSSCLVGFRSKTTLNVPGECTLLPLHHRERFKLEIDVVLARDVDDSLLDRPAGEREGARARVVVGDRLARVATDVQPLADQREVPGLGHDLALADLLVTDEERERAA